MSKYLLGGSAMLAVLLLNSPAVLAAATESSTEVQAFTNAKVSLTDAIKAAEQGTQGKVLGVNFEERQQHPAYTVRLVQKDKEQIIHVDADSGKVMGQPTDVAKSKLEQEDKVELSDVEKAKVSLTDAVKTAEQKAGGKAMDASLTTRGGKPVYEVEVANGKTMHMVKVDPDNGNITSTTAMKEE